MYSQMMTHIAGCEEAAKVKKEGKSNTVSQIQNAALNRKQTIM